MKLLTTIFFSALSATALACPTFNGTYACHGEGIDQTIHVQTSTVNGVTQYSMDDTHVLADGTYRKVAFMGGQYDMAASCQNDTLTLNVVLDGGNGDNADCGNEKWNLLYTLNWTPNGKNISESHSSSTVCASGKVVPSDVKGAMTCVLK